MPFMYFLLSVKHIGLSNLRIPKSDARYSLALAESTSNFILLSQACDKPIPTDLLLVEHVSSTRMRLRDICCYRIHWGISWSP